MKNCILLIVFLLILSCGGNTPAVVENREKVVDMIIDLQTIKEVVNIYPHEMKDSINAVLMNKFYEIHAVDSSALIDLFTGMRRDPELLKQLHEESLEKVTGLAIPQ